MNANPGDCDCERCEIDRERAPYQRAWLTAFHEATTVQVSAALDAVENGSHRDSAAAIGALLALTGLMLEKESELSGAVVGGAAGQQDQGEQSPMSAAEMERRIGLMGRLNDAAARFRPQPVSTEPEPEVADHDADLWYAACFACTTSLQVVRQVRRQRAELPQRDLMGEAYLVVLARLAMEAEESRERLEDTAIPDIDDGLTDARRALLAEAHAAMDEMAETVAADLRAFNQDLPVEIRPAMRGLPAVTERAAALVVGPADFHVGRFERVGPQPAPRRGRTVHRLLLPRGQGGPVDTGQLPDGVPGGGGSTAGGPGDWRAVGNGSGSGGMVGPPAALSHGDVGPGRRRSPRRGGGSLQRVRVDAARAGPAPRRHAGGAGGGGGG